MRIIRDRAIVDDDTFVHLADDAPVPEGADVILTLERWRAERGKLAGRRGRVGVRIPNDLDAEELESELPSLALIALEIPKFTDGRAYSQARTLRDHLRYTGEIRATGNVLRDQIGYLSRCGVNAFELSAGKSFEDAMAAFDEVPVHYQPDAHTRVPLWKRSARA